MLRISKLADYATIIMHFMAQQEASLSASQIAQVGAIALPTVSKILKLLNEANLVVSTRGVHGGYRLARSADMISVADIVSAIDGSPAVIDCVKGGQFCDYHATCQLQYNWKLINTAIFTLLNSLSLLDMSRPLSQIFLDPESTIIGFK